VAFVWRNVRSRPFPKKPNGRGCEKMQMVNVTIDNCKIQVPANYTVLEAAKQANIDIPTLCFLKDINEVGACRMCVVEVKGARSYRRPVYIRCPKVLRCTLRHRR